MEKIAQVLDTDIFELLALGESNVIYINSTNKDETSNNQSAYIINNSLPSDYQNLLVKNERLQTENKFYKEKIKLLEEKIAYLEKNSL